MIKSFLRGQIRKFSAHYSYDTSYMKEIIDADTGAAVKLALATGFLQHKFGLPSDIYFAAKIRSTRFADCGPCTRLAVAMAVEAGMSHDTALKIAVGDPLTGDLALACHYADQMLADGPDLPETIEKVRSRFGEQGVRGLAAAVIAGQFYPLLKRGVGHATACEPVIAEFRAELTALAGEKQIERPAA